VLPEFDLICAGVIEQDVYSFEGITMKLFARKAVLAGLAG